MMNATQPITMPGVVLPGTFKANLFPITSRYYGIDTATLQTTTGRTIIYLHRRFVPSPERFTLLQEHTITEGDRLDNIADHYLGDPEQFWRIADANNAMNPSDLVKQPENIGRMLRITLPEGILGVLDA